MRRAVLTLLAGGALAQALPLLLGPWLTRLYRPEEFGTYHLFAAVAANLAVVACARYEFALPLAQDEAEASALRRLCWRLLLATTTLAALAGLAWSVQAGAWWPLWLPAAVWVLGLVSLATLSATRAQRFSGLALARVVQHGGGALGQLVGGLWHAGVVGLIVAPLAAALAAMFALGWPASGAQAAGPAAKGAAAVPGWRDVARRHRSFPLMNTPHAFLGALQDTVSVALIAGSLGPAAAGAWGLALRYLKAPATLVGGAVSQALYPRLVAAGRTAGDDRAAAPGMPAACTPAARQLVVRTMALLALLAAPGVVALWVVGPWLFSTAFGAEWADAGVLARALALYIGLHFVASPLGVVTMAWQAQAWALKLALIGQALFVGALALGLVWGGLRAAGWAVSGVMAVYFGWYFFRLACWPVQPALPAQAAARSAPEACP